MKIFEFKAENIKRLRAVQIRPKGNLVEITGKNAQGKTSLLDAILWALDTNKSVQSKPVRDGADRGYIQLDLGEYIVTKTFKRKEDGDVGIALTVTNRDGAKYGSPTELVNGFLGRYTFDPLAFSRMKPADQVVGLRALVPDYDFDEADKANKKDFSDRTDVNRSVRDLKPRIEAIVIPDGTPAERISIDGLMTELRDAMDANSAIDAANNERFRVQERIAHLNEGILGRARQIADLKSRIAELESLDEAARASIVEFNQQLEGSAEAVATKRDIDAIRARITEAERLNRSVEQRSQREALVAEQAALEAKSAALTRAIDERKAAAAKAVRDAKLPVAGLDITEEMVLLNGQPFDQASDAEQLRVSVAIAGAMNPKLRIVRIRDGSLLDGESMEALTAYAEEHDLQIWVETVESGRPAAFVIEDGMVADQLEAAE